MRKWFNIDVRTLLLTLLLALLGSRDVTAQSVSLGAHIGYSLDALNPDNDEGTIFVGLQPRIYPVSLPIILNPGIDYYRNGNYDRAALQIEINGIYRLGARNAAFTPYAGLGPSVTTLLSGSASEVDLGLNLLGGATVGDGSLRPYLQCRITLGKHAIFPNRREAEGELTVLDYEEGSGFSIMVGVLIGGNSDAR